MEDLVTCGWYEENEKVAMKLHDKDDMLYKFPREIVKGCSCRKKCGRCDCKGACSSPSCETFRLTCGCKKRGRCSRFTCKNCPCIQLLLAEEEIAQVNPEPNESLDSDDEEEDMDDELDEFTFDYPSDYSDSDTDTGEDS